MLHSLLQFSSEKMTDTLKEFHFTDEQIDVLLEALIWTIDNGNYTDEEHKCARELYVTKLQSYPKND